MALIAHIVSRSSTQHFHGDDALLTDAALVTAANRNIKGSVEVTWRGPEIRFDKLADVAPLALVRFGMEAGRRTQIGIVPIQRDVDRGCCQRGWPPTSPNSNSNSA